MSFAQFLSQFKLSSASSESETISFCINNDWGKQADLNTFFIWPLVLQRFLSSYWNKAGCLTLDM